MRSHPVPDPPPLSDGVISLRRRQLQDVAAIAAASEDEQTRRWLTDVPPSDVDPQAMQFRDDHHATLAYSVFPAARGRGVAGRAVALVSTWCFGALGLAEVRLEIAATNVSSRRVAEKAGWLLVDGALTPEGGLIYRRVAPKYTAR